MENLQILAGPKALKHIQRHGLQVEDVSAVFAASGAAKWLAIYGLDRAIFEHWLKPRKSPLPVFGTSVGAWKLAAAAQSDPGLGLHKLATAYIEQTYQNKATQNDVLRETEKIVQRFLPQTKVEEILQHPFIRYHCGTVRCKGLLASDNSWSILGGMSAAMLRSLGPHKNYRKIFDRQVFSDPRDQVTIAARDGIKSFQTDLDADNFISAVRASGSIPHVFPGIKNINNAPPGVYRDGGLLDYHPLPQRFWPDQGLILYPHFYPHITPNWFDKFYPKRKASAAQLDNVVMLAPSQAFVDKLPGGRLPDRQDFKIYQGKNQQRIERWFEAMQLSKLLGDEFLAASNAGDIGKLAKAF